ncbi:Formin Homology 2 Domain, variant 2 [Dermatophagoides farinae]|uniref:Formin Homology 2 Domain, variant 2 n=1 Tax=Dermatophagoides farinae TaxID=6954 RepID=A0A922HYV7_DERFA|nr:Formin Homology 2 Domain, variant 2 [Dermatophagoides farinae]
MMKQQSIIDGSMMTMINNKNHRRFSFHDEIQIQRDSFRLCLRQPIIFQSSNIMMDNNKRREIRAVVDGSKTFNNNNNNNNNNDGLEVNQSPKLSVSTYNNRRKSHNPTTKFYLHRGQNTSSCGSKSATEIPDSPSQTNGMAKNVRKQSVPITAISTPKIIPKTTAKSTSNLIRRNSAQPKIQLNGRNSQQAKIQSSSVSSSSLSSSRITSRRSLSPGKKSNQTPNRSSKLTDSKQTKSAEPINRWRNRQPQSSLLSSRNSNHQTSTTAANAAAASTTTPSTTKTKKIGHHLSESSAKVVIGQVTQRRQRIPQTTIIKNQSKQPTKEEKDEQNPVDDDCRKDIDVVTPRTISPSSSSKLMLNNEKILSNNTTTVDDDADINKSMNNSEIFIDNESNCIVINKNDNNNDDDRHVFTEQFLYDIKFKHLKHQSLSATKISGISNNNNIVEDDTTSVSIYDKCRSKCPIIQHYHCENFDFYHHHHCCWCLTISNLRHVQHLPVNERQFFRDLNKYVCYCESVADFFIPFSGSNINNKKRSIHTIRIDEQTKRRKLIRSYSEGSIHQRIYYQENCHFCLKNYTEPIIAKKNGLKN